MLFAINNYHTLLEYLFVYNIITTYNNNNYPVSVSDPRKHESLYAGEAGENPRWRRQLCLHVAEQLTIGVRTLFIDKINFK